MYYAWVNVPCFCATPDHRVPRAVPDPGHTRKHYVPWRFDAVQHPHRSVPHRCGSRLPGDNRSLTNWEYPLLVINDLGVLTRFLRAT